MFIFNQVKYINLLNPRDYYSYNFIFTLFFFLGQEREDDMAKLKPNAKRYDCPHCPRILYLTPTEMLKHKKSHL